MKQRSQATGSVVQRPSTGLRPRLRAAARRHTTDEPPPGLASLHEAQRCCRRQGHNRERETDGSGHATGCELIAGGRTCPDGSRSQRTRTVERRAAGTTVSTRHGPSSSCPDGRRASASGSLRKKKQDGLRNERTENRTKVFAVEGNGRLLDFTKRASVVTGSCATSGSTELRLL